MKLQAVLEQVGVGKRQLLQVSVPVSRRLPSNYNSLKLHDYFLSAPNKVCLSLFFGLFYFCRASLVGLGE